MPFVRVALDLPIPRLFDYIAPKTESEIPPGTRVLVPFGPRRHVGVVIESVDKSSVGADKLKEVLAVLRDTPPLSREWLALVQFCSEYYHRPLGEVAMSALPPRLRRPDLIKTLAQAWTITANGRAALANAAGRTRIGPEKRAILDHLIASGERSQDELAALSPRAAKALRELARAEWIAPAELPAPHWTFVARTPTERQQVAIDALAEASDRFVPFVLFGVTGSGKTEVYLHAIHRIVREGHQALVLVPEINLTPQLAGEFRSRFPGLPIVILHSALAGNERAQAWVDAQTGRARIVLGTRMAVFTPFRDLRIIVVDEEHDSSFKQQDGVRYSARDLAVVRARALNIPVVLGSATPALETFANGETGRYRTLSLPERARPGALLPTIRLIDVRQESPPHGVSQALSAALSLRIERGEQSLVYLNRRGYAPVLACGACGWVADCTRCTAHMVVHMEGKQDAAGVRKAFLRCHHCGLEQSPPRACPTCGNVDLVAFGRGTQRLEDAIVALFPRARVLRIDSDSTRNKGSWDSMRTAIAGGDVDILIGTQILAKGHDFPRLTLVGVLNADASLMAGDYRAPERLFSQLQQVAGRAGRGELHGEVLIQTRYAHAALYQSLVRNDYRGFARQQLAERTSAGFPPSTAEAVLRAEARDVESASGFLLSALRVAPKDQSGVTIFDPVPMTLTRLSGWERAHVLVQSSSRRALQAFLGQWVASLHALPVQRDLRWHVDVDPLEF
ncbi:MAG: primosomal protein N' [Burkholderiales bacterium]